MKASLLLVLTIMSIAVIFPAFLANYKTENVIQASGAPEWLVIEGLVENPLNISYAKLRNFPQISEVTMLQCVGGGQGGYTVTYNWGGIPLFYLLSMAKVIPGDYREVVFRATDLFSSSVTLQTAMEPTTILALWANGTDLEQVPYWFGRGYRVVLPCRWGYKWVKWVNRITIVDYDYKGTYEQLGYSDEAFRPNCTMPETNPPIQNFTGIGLIEYFVQALSSSSIETFSYNPYTKLVFNISGPEASSGYFYVRFLKDFLAGPYQVYMNGNPIEYSQTEADGNVYLCFTYAHSSHTIIIEGTLEGVGGGGGRIYLIR